MGHFSTIMWDTFQLTNIFSHLVSAKHGSGLDFIRAITVLSCYTVADRSALLLEGGDEAWLCNAACRCMVLCGRSTCQQHKPLRLQDWTPTRIQSTRITVMTSRGGSCSFSTGMIRAKAV